MRFLLKRDELNEQKLKKPEESIKKNFLHTFSDKSNHSPLPVLNSTKKYAIKK